MQALIIGPGGIGGDLALRMAEAGWSVLLAGRKRSRLEELAASCQAQIFADVDATDFASMDKLENELRGQLGDGHLAIINAVGSLLLKPAHRTSEADWQHTLSTNLGSAFLTVRLATRLNRPCSVLLFSSAAAQIGLANHEAIAASKAGIEGLVRSAAATYAKKNVIVNAIAPGLVDTPLAKPITSQPAALKASQAFHPLGRIGTTDAITTAAMTLTHPDMDWVTGAVWQVDGGLANCRS